MARHYDLIVTGSGPAGRRAAVQAARLKKRAAEALSYNALVQSWAEITRLAREGGAPQRAQAEMFEDEV